MDGGTVVSTYESGGRPERDPEPMFGDTAYGNAPLPGVGPNFDPWNYRADAGWSTEMDVVGYHVEAIDGRIGKIDEASHAMDSSYLVVDTGPWIFGRKVLLPAGTVSNIDHADRVVYVDRTKNQIKTSPEFDPDMYTDAAYRDKIRSHYDDTYRTPPM
jgi:hypothetical protein